MEPGQARGQVQTDLDTVVGRGREVREELARLLAGHTLQHLECPVPKLLVLPLGKERFRNRNAAEFMHRLDDLELVRSLGLQHAHRWVLAQDHLMGEFTGAGERDENRLLGPPARDRGDSLHDQVWRACEAPPQIGGELLFCDRAARLGGAAIVTDALCEHGPAQFIDSLEKAMVDLHQLVAELPILRAGTSRGTGNHLSGLSTKLIKTGRRDDRTLLVSGGLEELLEGGTELCAEGRSRLLLDEELDEDAINEFRCVTGLCTGELWCEHVVNRLA